MQSALTVTGKISNWELLYTGGWFERKVDNLVDYTEYTVAYDQLYFGTSYNYNRLFNNAGQMIDPSQSTKNRDRYTKQNHEFRVNSPAEYRLRGTAGLFYQRQTTIFARHSTSTICSSRTDRRRRRRPTRASPASRTPSICRKWTGQTAIMQCSATPLSTSPTS